MKIQKQEKNTMPKIKKRTYWIMGLVFLFGVGLYMHSRFVVERKDVIKYSYATNVQAKFACDFDSNYTEQDRVVRVNRKLEKIFFNIFLEVIYIISLCACLVIPLIIREKHREEYFKEKEYQHKLEISQLQQICNGLVRKRMK